MGRTARRLLLGLVVLVAVWAAAAGTVGSSPSSDATTVVGGAVSATGAGVLPAGWTVSHPAPGAYVLRAPVAAPDLDVETWDEAAEVSLAPVGDGGVSVRFERDGLPVDSRFTWRAVVTR
jgi:hypothetical protein